MGQGIAMTQGFHGLIGASPSLRGVIAEAERAAASDLEVLVTGETGTGKELLARAIHAASARRRGPFLAVDCSTLPSETLPAELFGHARGAFSGAERERIGRFEAARGGSVFLDRIDDLDPAAQSLLLRVIEEREVVRLGESRPRQVDFRLLTSAGPELKRRSLEGRFRRDLYYRINAVELALPPLRERREDLPFLAREFLADCARRFGKPLTGFSPRALEILGALDWPGNVRELKGTVEAAAASARGELIQESDLPVRVRVAFQRLADGVADPCPRTAATAGATRENGPTLSTAPPPTSGFAERVTEFQRALLLEALGRSSWSHPRAARELGLERHQLKYLCAKLGVRRSAIVDQGPG
jgi:transcriptional regulator with GAF, ATPase, and Fis domain